MLLVAEGILHHTGVNEKYRHGKFVMTIVYISQNNVSTIISSFWYRPIGVRQRLIKTQISIGSSGSIK